MSTQLVSPQEVEALLASHPEMVVLDVRTPDEMAEGRLACATAAYDFNAGDIAQAADDLDPDGEYLVYCRSGHRSGQSVSFLEDQGFGNVWDLDGGFLACESAGLEITADPID